MSFMLQQSFWWINYIIYKQMPDKDEVHLSFDWETKKKIGFVICVLRIVINWSYCSGICPTESWSGGNKASEFTGAQQQWQIHFPVLDYGLKIKQ